ncbi:MAG TPA: PLP-dependent aminotransferase family protein, partial [Candidatus Cloacimonadota bacterium]|nr:PLP-dependent aminotransferase family protein [Candidatus Cloacimonadota bacterium]
MKYKEYFSETTLNMGSSMIRELVASTKNIPDLISFAGGFPSPKTFPKQELSQIYAEVVAEEGTDVLQYGQSEGDSLLKKEFFRWEGYEDLNDDDALITVGATNGIYYF